jgi:hypothetical protein
MTTPMSSAREWFDGRAFLRQVLKLLKDNLRWLLHWMLRMAEIVKVDVNRLLGRSGNS